MNISASISADARDSRAPFMVLCRLVEYLSHDGQVPARQPGSGEATALRCYVNPEQSYHRVICG